MFVNHLIVEHIKTAQEDRRFAGVVWLEIEKGYCTPPGWPPWCSEGRPRAYGGKLPSGSYRLPSQICMSEHSRVFVTVDFAA